MEHFSHWYVPDLHFSNGNAASRAVKLSKSAKKKRRKKAFQTEVVDDAQDTAPMNMQEADIDFSSGMKRDVCRDGHSFWPPGALRGYCEDCGFDPYNLCNGYNAEVVGDIRDGAKEVSVGNEHAALPVVTLSK